MCPEGRGEKTGAGWSDLSATHCRECGATFRGNSNHCKKCHLTFATLDAGYRLHTDRGHPDPSMVGLVAQENRYGTIEWGTAEGFAARAAVAARMAGVTQDSGVEAADEVETDVQP
jgi:hypothetical protein